MTTPSPVRETDRAPEHLDERALEPPVERPALGLSAAQVAGSALAAVTGAFVASWLGVTGTLTGVAIGSVVGTVGSASYTYSLRRGHAVVRTGRPVPEPAAPRWGWVRRVPWARVAVAATVALVAGLLTLTVVERLAGRPVSSITTGSSATGTTLGRTVHQVVDGGSGGSGQPSQEAPTPTPTQQPSPSPTGTPTPTPDPTPTPTPSPTVEPSPSPTPSSPATP